MKRSHLAQPTQPDDVSVLFWCGRSAPPGDLTERTLRTMRASLCDACVAARTFAGGHDD